MELVDNYFRFWGCMLHNRPNKLCEKAKVGGGKKTTAGWRILPKTGWWTDALRLTRGRSVRSAMVGFDSQICLWRALHQMQPRAESLYPPIPLFNFLSSLHSEWTNSVFPATPLRDRGSHIYSSRKKGKRWRKARKKREKEITNPTCLTQGHRTVRRPEKGWKDRENQGQGRRVSRGEWALTTRNNWRRWKKG